MPELYYPFSPSSVTEWAGTPRPGGPHLGTDFGIPQGTPCPATSVATVAWTGDDGLGAWCIDIVRDDGLVQRFGHLSRIDVSAGQVVVPGQIIGLTGGTPGTPGAGTSTGPHLHWEVRWDRLWNGGSWVDPRELNPRLLSEYNPQPPIDKDKPVAYITGYTSSYDQIVPAGSARWVETAAGASAIASGAGDYLVETTFDLAGTAGTNVTLTSYRVTVDNGVETTTIIEPIDVVLESNGRARRQLVIANRLAANERLRTRIEVPAGGGQVKVDRYSWRGFKWDL